ncbi:MAG: 3-deoxy-D-manno-octulosonic acid transferase [Proteobacteria bacterium]|nr:MAG: 3-deoxy-D-manno-octulosonic acid transferase [Pseudomonadota bacterium]
MGRYLYTFIYCLIFPFILLRLRYRAGKAPAYLQRWRERLGRVPVPSMVRLLRHQHNSGAKTLWLHSVSVGETVAAIPLVRQLLARHSNLEIVVTTMTPTGSERVVQTFGDQVVHCYAPYDTPGAVKRFLSTVRPDMLVIMETELWPNMIYYSRQAGAEVIVVNGRLSARSAQGYSRVGWLSAPMIRMISRLLVQNDEHARRFGSLGAKPEQVNVTGSIKFDISVEERVRLAGQSLRALLGQERRVWIGASTHQGEDEILLRVHQKLLEACPDSVLILVPRHPERFDSVIKQVADSGFQYSRQSACSGLAENRGVQVHVGDTMGEMLSLYAASDVAFVGGSLVPGGGHNPIEPAALGLPVIMGAHVFNFLEICQNLQAAGGLELIDGEDALFVAIHALFTDPEKSRRAGQAGQQFVEDNRGALARCVNEINRLLFDL